VTYRLDSVSTLPNTSDDGLVCLGSVRVTGASVGERVDDLIGAFWGSLFTILPSCRPLSRNAL